MTNTVSFHEPTHLQTMMAWSDITGITLDEFYLFDKEMIIEKYRSGEKHHSKVKIEDACYSLRKKIKNCSSASVYKVNISMNKALDPHFQLPKDVEDMSLFPRFYPDYESSKFFRKHYKTFQAYQENYISPPQISYGGLAEWLYVTKGQLDLTLYQPTKINLLRFHALGEGEHFLEEDGTKQEHKVTAGSMFCIPPGYITVRGTRKNAFTYSGKILSYLELSEQLKSFEMDVNDSNFKHALEIDSEIRALYWFFTISLIPSKHALKSSKDIADNVFNNKQSYDDLRKQLKEWREKWRKCISDHSICFPPEVYVPYGIRSDLILKDLGGISRRGRRFLQGDKDTVDVSMSQTSTDNKPD